MTFSKHGHNNVLDTLIFHPNNKNPYLQSRSPSPRTCGQERLVLLVILIGVFVLFRSLVNGLWLGTTRLWFTKSVLPFIILVSLPFELRPSSPLCSSTEVFRLFVSADFYPHNLTSWSKFGHYQQKNGLYLMRRRVWPLKFSPYLLLRVSDELIL